MKKLYIVRKEVVIYAMANDDENVAQQLRDAMRQAEQDDGGSEIFDYESITRKPSHLEGEWDEYSLIYGVDNNTTLGSVIERLSE